MAKRKPKKKKKEQWTLFDEDFDTLSRLFDLTDPELVLSLMYGEAFKRSRERKTDYIS